MKFDSYLVSELEHHTRLAVLLEAIATMESSALHYGIPKAETLARVFKAARAISDYRVGEMS